MKNIALVVTIFALSAGAAFPQEIAKDNRCFAGSLSYSPGATVGAADGVFECTAEGIWVATERSAMGCSAEGTFYSVGVAYQKGTSTAMFECTSDGIWKAVGE